MGSYGPITTPYQVGDVLWCRETFFVELPGDLMWDAEGLRLSEYPECLKKEAIVHYRADSALGEGWKWRPSAQMPRWASRLSLVVTAVKVERLQEISEVDCRAEGCRGGHDSIPNFKFSATPREHYRHQWNADHPKHPWQSNPWVAAYTVERREG
jgi:hypothetical protein